MPDEAPLTRIVGREAELTRIRAVLARARAGESAAMVITGEPGIGKTALARAAYDDPDGPGQALVVRCLPLQTLSTGLAPLRLALRTSPVPAAVTAGCLARMDQGDPIRAVDDWVDAVVAEAPLVVVVDDLQWADADLRDMVLYLVAGPRERRFAVVVTVRTTGLPDGHPIHGWLAEVLRFPHVERLEAGPLSRVATEAQLVGLLGGHAHQSLVEDVFRTGRGNPFLTSLLARTIDVTDRHLPAELPGDLTTAVKGAWHQCSLPTRTLTCLLAVAGAPARSDRLQQVADDLALDLDVPAAVAEAAAAGLLEPAAGGWWFHHPLQAEVLEGSVAAADRPRWQAAYARFGDADLVAGPGPTLALAVAQAVRHDQAGSAADAYRWALRAWAIGRGRRSTAELRRVLRRAIALRPQVPHAAETPELLWQAVRELAVDDGAYAEELEAVETLLSIIDDAERPLQVSELLVRRMLLRAIAALEFYSVPDMHRAVRLASVDRSSWQYALALGELAHAGFWHGDPAATAGADEALAVARSAGHPTALSFALTMTAMLAIDQGRFADALPLATEAVDLAAAAGDGWAFVHATMWEANASAEPFGEETADRFRRRREQLAALGGADTYLVQIAAVEAELRLDLGDVSACARLLREAILSDPGPIADLGHRATAARLAAYQGRTADALGHVSRANDLIGDRRDFRNLNLDAIRATVLLAAGRPVEAYQAAWTTAVQPGVAVTMAGYLVPLAARALADQVEQARDHRGSDRDYLVALTALRTRFPTVIDAEESASPLWQLRLAALQAWYDAETARAGRDPEESGRWAAMRAASAAGRLPWLELYACWRGAEAVLRHGRTGRADGIRLLRAGHDLAVRLAADGTRSELERLARLAHVDLAVSDVPPLTDEPRLATLTPRERELLGYLTQGLTYAEIAKALVISEKTVSSHVSNLLRKTGTAGRVELTRLVARIGT